MIIGFCWLYLLLAILIKTDDKGPILFKQTRVEKNGKQFTLHKFRSMKVGAEKKLPILQRFNEKDDTPFKMARDPRVTPFGYWLRKLSLDGLPQLFNVLEGEMSFVGPRPALPSEVARYTDYAR